MSKKSPQFLHRSRPLLKNLIVSSLAIVLLSCGLAAFAQPQLNVLALSKNKAIVRVNGVKRVLFLGQTSPEGIKLLNSSSRGATVEIDGMRLRLHLGQRGGQTIKKPVHMNVTLWPDKNGMYRSLGKINGQSIRFLVDTGATFIAINRRRAQQLGLDYKSSGTAINIATASGRELGYKIKLDQVQLGTIKLYKVNAVVIESDYPQQALLGMSFLRRLKMRREGAALYLQR